MSELKKCSSEYSLLPLRNERQQPNILPVAQRIPPVPPPRTRSSQQLLRPSSQSDGTSTERQLLLDSRDRPIPRQRQNRLSAPAPHSPSTDDYTQFHPQRQQFMPANPPQLRHRLRYMAPLTLQELAQSPQYLPATIETLDGFHGFGRQLTISAGDKLHIHFAKHLKVAVLCDRIGSRFYIPLSSAMKFGLFQYEVQQFERVSDMARRMKSLPYVIFSEQYIPSHKGQEAVWEGEILIVTEYHEHGSKAGLLCHSLESEQEKHLLKSCRGLFTTSPEQTSMYLLSFLQHLSHLLPCKVHLYPPSHQDMYDMFTRGRVFTLERCTTVTSLVASNVSESDNDLFDIILDNGLSDLRVSVFGSAPALSPTRKNTIMTGHYTRLMKRDFASQFQQTLYATLRRGLEGEGVELVAGDTVRDVSVEYDYVDAGTLRPTNSSGGPSRAERNRQYLKTLSMHEVSVLLSVMGLEMYQAIFHREQVTGSFLAECNRRNLQSYLQISDTTHQRWLLQIIKGETSAKDLLNGHT